MLAFGPALAAVVLLIVLGHRRLGAVGVVRAVARADHRGAGSRGARAGGRGRCPAGPGRRGLALRPCKPARRRAESVAQIVAFGLGLTVLLMLAVMRGDLIDRLAREPARHGAQLLLRQHTAR